MTHARDERGALCDLLDSLGPDAATLCEGWRTTDLTAHLVLREHRPDAALGMLGGPLARHTDTVQQALRARNSYPALVRMVRSGPPRLSLFAIPGMDERVNFAEYFVHHEDVRRAQPGWQARDLGTAFSDALWRQLSRARLLLRKVPVGIEFARDDRPGPQAVRMMVRPKTPVVTVIGAPAELMLWTYGRTSVAQVRLEGAQADLTALTQARWKV